ncbi:hypothetical protein TWF718_003701 [Orbilia javanica]|uniref:Uncharacterized protein n=1 Tax=Orbilia javanica TaxID=47235 RepID=A0AAN8N3T4_9PEZI
MVFFSIPQPTSYRYIVVFAAIAIGSISLLFFQLQGRSNIFQVKRDSTTLGTVAEPSPSTGPPIIEVSPVNPFNINLDGTLYRYKDISQVKIEANPDLGGTASPGLPQPSEGNRLSKRSRVPVSWVQMRNFIRDQASSQVPTSLSLGVSAMIHFLSMLETYKRRVESVAKISDFLNNWRWKESEDIVHPSQQPEVDMLLFALRSYEDAVDEYPDFTYLMETIVGSFAAIGAFASFTEPDVMIRLIFMDAEENAQELDDEWLLFLITFFDDSAKDLRKWVTEVEFARDTFVSTIEELKSQVVSDEDFHRLLAKVNYILRWTVKFAKIGEEASTLLRESRQDMTEVLGFGTPGTLPYTPAIGQPPWIESLDVSEAGGDVFNLLSNEPLTPPSNFQDDEYITFLRSAPSAANENSMPMEEEEVANSEEFRGLEPS